MATDPTADPGRILVYPSRLKTSLVLLGAIAFVVLGVWIGTSDIAERVATWKVVVASYIGVPFFAACGLYAAYRLIFRRPSVELDSSGITDRASAIGAGRLGWDEVDCVVLYRYSGQPMLGIIPKDLDGFVRRQGRVRGLVIKANLALGVAPVNVPQVALSMKVADLAEMLRSRYGVRVEESV